MKTIARMRRSLVALAVVGAAFMAVSAAPAMATVHWSDTAHGVKLAGSLKVTSPGLPEKTCTFPAVSGVFFGPYAIIENESGAVLLNCGSTSMDMHVWMNPVSTSSVEFQEYGGLLRSPWSSNYFTLQTFADFTNGSGSTMSTVALSSDKIGQTQGGSAIYATGTLTITTSTGGLLTLLP